MSFVDNFCYIISSTSKQFSLAMTSIHVKNEYCNAGLKTTQATPIDYSFY